MQKISNELNDSGKVLLTDAYMDKIRRTSGTQYGLLTSYAKYPERSGPGVAQINRIWAALPEEMRCSYRLRRNIRNFKKEETFWGGLSEALIGYMLHESGALFEYQPKIDGKTPDFSCLVDGQRYLIEVVASSGDKGWDDYSEDYRLLKEELSKVHLPFRIYIKERLPNNQGVYHGIGKELTRYLQSLSKATLVENDEHAVEARGAKLRFTAERREDQEPFSFAGPGYPGGMPKPDKVLGIITEKAKTYSSNPLLVVYFCTTPVAEPARILLEALDGTWVYRAAGEETRGTVETWWESSGKGLWGANSRYKGCYANLCGVVAVTVSYSSDLMHFRVAKAIHPDHRGELVSLLPKIPDVFTSGSFDKTDPLVLVP